MRCFSGEHSMLACCFGQLAQKPFERPTSKHWNILGVVGKLPTTTGWQPVLPRRKKVPENFFARDSRSRVKLRDASDGAADGKIKNEKGHAAARAFSRGISLDAADAHARGKAR